MGHLFEKRKICHGCQGNYHSERKGGGGGREKKSPTAFMDRIRLWWNIIPARQTAAGSVLFLFSPHVILPLSVSLSSLIPLTSSPTVCLSLSLSAVFLLRPSYSPPLSLFAFLPPPIFLSLLQHHQKYQCEIRLQLEA